MGKADVDTEDGFSGVIPKDLAVGALWPQISALVERSLAKGRGERSIGDIKKGIDDGIYFAIGSADASASISFVAICAVLTFPQKRVLYVIEGAGRGGCNLADTLKGAAKQMNCDWIETRCRESVARLYRRHGFDIGWVVPILEVS